MPKQNPLTFGSSIGIIDSGIGGIVIAQQVMKNIPGAKITYVADTAFMPYGSRSSEEIQQLTARLIQWLVGHHQVTTVILACHTASAVAYDFLAAQFPTTHIIGLVDIVSTDAVKCTRTGYIGILATPATIKRGAHAQRIHQLNPTCTVYTQACSDLAYAIETQAAPSILKQLVALYTKSWLHSPIDTIVIGCTHYSIITPHIQEIFPSAQLVAAENILFHEKMVIHNHSPNQLDIYATVDPASVQYRCAAMYNIDVPVQHLSLPFPRRAI